MEKRWQMISAGLLMSVLPGNPGRILEKLYFYLKRHKKRPELERLRKLGKSSSQAEFYL
ncbi:hypothetical protein [Victivallis sp. Marseille-Q1083]|uniref:hypothetical protein n=1 Tax=Victivallis sp. Marseille-Q1083 TaxID=2717288 RepID=UPI00158E1467|nr:hypothetical protein [Victivallis sp. Marseille-Q1083]